MFIGDSSPLDKQTEFREREEDNRHGSRDMLAYPASPLWTTRNPNDDDDNEKHQQPTKRAPDVTESLILFAHDFDNTKSFEALNIRLWLFVHAFFIVSLSRQFPDSYSVPAITSVDGAENAKTTSVDPPRPRCQRSLSGWETILWRERLVRGGHIRNQGTAARDANQEK